MFLSNEGPTLETLQFIIIFFCNYKLVVVLSLASLKQQLSQSEDDYEILPLEICNYKLVVVLSLAQHISKTTVHWVKAKTGLRSL